jgi:hypothetical protein
VGYPRLRLLALLAARFAGSRIGRAPFYDPTHRISIDSGQLAVIGIAPASEGVYLVGYSFPKGLLISTSAAAGIRFTGTDGYGKLHERDITEIPDRE